MAPRPGALLLFLLALLPEISRWHVGAASGAPLGPHRGSRALRAAAPAASPASSEVRPQAAPGPAPEPAVDESQPGTIIETLVDQKCSVIHHALLVGQELVAAADNLQPDEVSCCQSCLARQDECNAWTYCPEAGGCAVAATPDVLAAAATAGDGAAALRAPHRGCRLLKGPAFRLHKDSPELAMQGLSVPFVSGTPVTISLPVLPNYSVRPGTDLARGLSYACEQSLVYSGCIIQGKVEELAAICDSDPLCKAFVYLPNGVDSLSEPIGILKGGEDSIPVSALKPNPATALYLKSSVATTTDGSGGGGSSTGCGSHGCSCRSGATLWIVLPTLLAAALIMVAAVAVYATVALRQQARRREADAAADAAAAAAKPRSSGKPSPPGSGAARTPPAGSAGGRPTPPGSGQHASPPGSGLSGGGVTAIAPGAPVPLPACLTVHLLKASPPNSGGSGRSLPGVPGSEHSSASRVTCGTSAGVPCPQCGSTLGIAAAAPVLVVPRQPRTPTRRQQQAQHVQQQQHAHPAQQQQQLSQPQQQGSRLQPAPPRPPPATQQQQQPHA